MRRRRDVDDPMYDARKATHNPSPKARLAIRAMPPNVSSTRVLTSAWGTPAAGGSIPNAIRSAINKETGIIVDLSCEEPPDLGQKTFDQPCCTSLVRRGGGGSSESCDSYFLYCGRSDDDKKHGLYERLRMALDLNV